MPGVNAGLNAIRTGKKMVLLRKRPLLALRNGPKRLRRATSWARCGIRHLEEALKEESSRGGKIYVRDDAALSEIGQWLIHHSLCMSLLVDEWDTLPAAQKMNISRDAAQAKTKVREQITRLGISAILDMDDEARLQLKIAEIHATNKVKREKKATESSAELIDAEQDFDEGLSVDR